MTSLAGKLRAPQGWAWCLAAIVALACGNVTSSPNSTPDPSDGGEGNTETPSAGKANVGTPTAGSISAFGGTTNVGGTTGGVTLVTGGTSTNTPNHPDFGGSGAGGESLNYGETSLCIYPEDIPANWGPGMVTVGNGHECTVGVLVPYFMFMGCPYELLDVTPYDVDPFTGGHSHCCYKSRLKPCR